MMVESKNQEETKTINDEVEAENQIKEDINNKNEVKDENIKQNEKNEPQSSAEDNEKDQKEDEQKTDEQELDEKKDDEEINKDEIIENLEEKIERLQAEKEGYINRLQRLQADFSNYRKRTDREMGKVQSQTIIELIRELLPIIDNFERALAQDTDNDDVKKGVEMIYRQLINFLEKQGVEIIAAQGEHFDHNYHEAVMQIESEEHESGIIIEEMQKGYILGDKIIRPAMVKVAQ